MDWPRCLADKLVVFTWFHLFVINLLGFLTLIDNVCHLCSVFSTKSLVYLSLLSRLWSGGFLSLRMLVLFVWKRATKVLRETLVKINRAVHLLYLM